MGFQPFPHRVENILFLCGGIHVDKLYLSMNHAIKEQMC